jgi:hypothetical protein
MKTDDWENVKIDAAKINRKLKSHTLFHIHHEQNIDFQDVITSLAIREKEDWAAVEICGVTFAPLPNRPKASYMWSTAYSKEDRYIDFSSYIKTFQWSTK